MPTKFRLIEEDIQKHIVLLDGHNVIFRTIFIAHEEIKKSGIEDPTFIYWKLMFMNNIKSVVEKFKPTRFILVFDSKGSWRKRVYPEYKAHRKEAREASQIDFDAFFKVLEPFVTGLQNVFPNIEILKVDGLEGDDIIAIMAQNFSDKITIISTDKDFYQLQTFKNVKQFNPVEKKYANVLNAKTALECKIIGGDKSDNISAIFPRCGKVAVEKVLKSDLISNIYDEEFLKEEENVKKIVEKYKIHPLEIRKNLERNTELIDFRHIPKDIQEKVLGMLNEPNLSRFDGRKFLSFLMENKLGKIVEKLNDYTSTLGALFYKGVSE
jgi:5'-3' exonuclease